MSRVESEEMNGTHLHRKKGFIRVSRILLEEARDELQVGRSWVYTIEFTY